MPDDGAPFAFVAATGDRSAAQDEQHLEELLLLTLYSKNLFSWSYNLFSVNFQMQIWVFTLEFSFSTSVHLYIDFNIVLDGFRNSIAAEVRTTCL